MTTSALNLRSSSILVVRDRYPILKIVPLVIAIVFISSSMLVFVETATERVSVLALVDARLNGPTSLMRGNLVAILCRLVRAYDAG